jgi:hypothetical protein
MWAGVKMKKFCLASTAMLAFVGLSPAAWADAPEILTPEPEETSRSGRDRLFSITPRVGYLWTNLNVPNTSSTEQMARSTMDTPTAGLTLEIRPSEKLDLSVTGLYGAAEGKLYGTSGGININGDYSVTRTDVEALVRYFPDQGERTLPAYLVAGVRYIGLEVEDTLGGNVVFSSTGSNVGHETIDFLALEIGGGVAAPLSDSLTYISSALVGYGVAQTESDTGSHITGATLDQQYGPMGDLSVGLNYSPSSEQSRNSAWSLSLRYRATIVPVHYAAETSTFDFWVTHGLEASASVRF